MKTDTTSPASEFFADGRDWCPTAQQQGEMDQAAAATFAEEQAESAGDDDDDDGRGWDNATGSPWPNCPNCGTVPVEGKYPGGCSQCDPAAYDEEQALWAAWSDGGKLDDPTHLAAKALTARRIEAATAR